MTLKNGDVIRADFHAEFDNEIDEDDAQFTANGTCKYANGDVYEGEFIGTFEHYWYPHNEGTMTYKDGQVDKGPWKEGIPANIGKYGTVTWPGGVTYTGEFKDGLKHGKGKETDRDGNIIHEGLWEKGKFVG